MQQLRKDHPKLSDDCLVAMWPTLRKEAEQKQKEAEEKARQAKLDKEKRQSKKRRSSDPGDLDKLTKKVS